jgi:membrane associated rhomboid family serine protease
MLKLNSAVTVLIALNIIVFAIVELVPGMETKMYDLLALHFPKNKNFAFWQFVTSMFMHGGFMHILFNMYGLWAFGSLLEHMWGKNRFLIFYFLSGIGAGVIYILVNYYRFNTLYDEFISLGISPADIQKLMETGQYNSASMQAVSAEQMARLYQLFNTPAVGASGALYGILVAFGMSFPNAKLALIFLPFPIAAKYFIPGLVALDLFSGVTGFSIFGGGIAHFAHVGGALIGFLLMWYWRKEQTKHSGDAVQTFEE